MLNCFLFSRVRWEDWYQPRVCVFSAAAESGCVELNVNTGKQGETAGPVLSDVRGIQLYQHLQSSVINTLHLVCLISQQTRTKKPNNMLIHFTICLSVCLVLQNLWLWDCLWAVTVCTQQVSNQTSFPPLTLLWKHLLLQFSCKGRRRWRWAQLCVWSRRFFSLLEDTLCFGFLQSVLNTRLQHPVIICAFFHTPALLGCLKSLSCTCGLWQKKKRKPVPEEI